MRPRATVNLWKARLQFFQKHYSPGFQVLARALIRAGLNRRIQATARDSSQSEEERKAMIEAYREVIKLTRQTDLVAKEQA
ncbi:MAG: hypothetical protein GYB68_18985 [Chloroflexi bacterium]|nr:hypothetical protein [Chloroflexota bacterium]